MSTIMEHADLAYAGDRLWHLYRFDLTDDDFDDRTVTLLFTATYDDAGVDQI
jgi:Tfp pilus tip-associated adhesin PilY1